MGQKKSSEKSQTVGVCKFCGQTRVYDWMPDDPDFEATMDCSCAGPGESFRQKTKILNLAYDNIESIFRNDFPEVADSFQALKENVYDGKIGRVTFRLPGGATARLWMPTATAMKIDYRKTSVTELSTGL